MFSITLKRSAATLSIVVAGLLAAAGPANAQFWEGMSLMSQAPRTNSVSGQEMMNALRSANAPANAVTASISAQSGLERIAAPDWDGSNKQSAYFLELSFDAKSAKEGLYFKAPGPTAGTQVGSEGVKSPTDPASGYTPPIGTDKGSLKAAGTETGNPEHSGPALASSRAGAFALELEGKIVKAPASPTSLVFTSVSNVAVATAVVGGLVPGGAIVSA